MRPFNSFRRYESNVRTVTDMQTLMKSTQSPEIDYVVPDLRIIEEIETKTEGEVTTLTPDFSHLTERLSAENGEKDTSTKTYIENVPTSENPIEQSIGYEDTHKITNVSCIESSKVLAENRNLGLSDHMMSDITDDSNSIKLEISEEISASPNTEKNLVTSSINLIQSENQQISTISKPVETTTFPKTIDESQSLPESEIRATLKMVIEASSPTTPSDFSRSNPEIVAVPESNININVNEELFDYSTSKSDCSSIRVETFLFLRLRSNILSIKSTLTHIVEISNAKKDEFGFIYNGEFSKIYLDEFRSDVWIREASNRRRQRLTTFIALLSTKIGRLKIRKRFKILPVIYS